MKFSIEDCTRIFEEKVPWYGHRITYIHNPTGLRVSETLLVGWKLYKLDNKLLGKLMKMVEEFDV
jgi:hypothetical protein